MENLIIEYLPIEQIKPYEHNARAHKDEDVNAIKASIQEFGFDDPIGIWSDDNIIVEGHGRLMAAKELGMDTVPVIRLDHLSDEQRRAYALAHNRTAELSGWDFLIRDEELARIAELDMSQFGFTDEALKKAVGGDDDEIPDRPVFNYREQYGVIVMCKDEADQEDIYNRLTEEGYDCKVVAT